MLALNTRVMTPWGYKELQNLERGDKILCYGPTTNVYAALLNVKYEGQRRLYRYTFGQKYIDCTPFKKVLFDHRFCKIRLATLKTKEIFRIQSLNGPLMFTKASYIGYEHTCNIEIDTKYHYFFANDLIIGDSTLW